MCCYMIHVKLFVCWLFWNTVLIHAYLFTNTFWFVDWINTVKHRSHRSGSGLAITYKLTNSPYWWPIESALSSQFVNWVWWTNKYSNLIHTTIHRWENMVRYIYDYDVTFLEKFHWCNGPVICGNKTKINVHKTALL